MAERFGGPGPVGGSIAERGGTGIGSSRGDTRPDLEGARAAREDVGSLPVPRSVLQAKGRKLPPVAGSPYDLERGLQPGARRPLRPAARGAPAGALDPREEEARLRRSLPRAARTPEELGRALSHIGDSGVKDPQRGHEAGPPLPGEPGYSGER